MAAINSLQALNSYQSTTNWFSQTRAIKSMVGTSNPISFQFARYASSLFANTAASGLASILTASNQLHSSAEVLRNSGAALLNNRVVSSSDNASVTATADKGAKLHSVNVSVQAVAASQTNSGTSFNAASTTTFQTGIQKFSITLGNNTTHVSFFANATDTHQTSLGKMRDAIIASDSGVAAKIVKNPANSSIHLELSSKNTGISNSFNIADVTGSAVSSTGSQFVQSAAANASYTVNGGVQQTSSSNQIKLDQGKITATLLKPTSADVSLTTKPDADAIVKQTKQLVNDYNTLQARISDESGYLNPTVKRNLQNTLHSNALDTLGITKQTNGTLTLDDTKLKNNIDSQYDQVSRSLTGSNGIASVLSKAADRLKSSPADALLNQNNSEYKRYNNYQSTLQFYSQLPTTGLLLNNFF
jgi:flagellar hook-associated protein 2